MSQFKGLLGIIYLNHEISAAFGKALQHAQEEMRRLHQVFEVGLRLFGFIILPQQGQENFPVFHQVKYVAWETRRKGEQTQLST